MSVSLEFGNYNNYNISESRLSLMMHANKKSAIHMSLWEQFKDLFRTEKKSEAYNELYDLLHNTEGADALDIFNRLKGFANPDQQYLFTKDIHCSDVVFCIGHKQIAKCSMQSILNISEQTPLHPMSSAEQQLILVMLDTLREKESLFSDGRPSELRTMVSDEHCHELLALYRPEEDLYANGTEWNTPEVITDSEKDTLRCLNAGSMTSFSQFSFVGYQTFSAGVEFTVIHPTINYLLGTYTRDRIGEFSFAELNSGYLNVLNKGYEEYQKNKDEVDRVLKKIYEAHGETLNISLSGQNRNKLVTPPDNEIQYERERGLYSYEQSVHSSPAIFAEQASLSYT